MLVEFRVARTHGFDIRAGRRVAHGNALGHAGAARSEGQIGESSASSERMSPATHAFAPGRRSSVAFSRGDESLASRSASSASGVDTATVKSTAANRSGSCDASFSSQVRIDGRVLSRMPVIRAAGKRVPIGT
jgi:hypothetical protein